MTTRSRILSILFWSVISAAFIGPGTLSTAAAAGASFDFQLIWALCFATVACIVLQEMAARITIASGKEIGDTLKNVNGKPSWLIYFIAFGVILGCAAYEAGNILGAIAGITLMFDFNRHLLTLFLGLICGGLLWWGSVRVIANILGAVVAVMGMAFIFVAIQIDLDKVSLARGFIPSMPDGAEWLVLGLIGTTIVPYNLFLGSGLGRGQDLGQMRFGLIISVALGGIVSMAILITGSQINDIVSFDRLAFVMGETLGAWAKIMLAIGLFAAGFTSSITAPLAAGILAKSIAPQNGQQVYKATWLLVLITGLGFGISEVKPIPIIIAAQALNGMILPAVAILLIIQANNVKIMTPQYLNGSALNILALIILNAVLLIGINNIFKAMYTAFDQGVPNDLSRLLLMQLVSLPVMVFTIYKIRMLRRG